MNYALERNRYREGLYCKQQAFESWRQLIEVILASCPPELLNREVKQTMIFDVMRDLLVKVGLYFKIICLEGYGSQNFFKRALKICIEITTKIFFAHLKELLKFHNS